MYNCTDNRIHKPFNPLLGETFELRTEDYRFFAEQVSHHPPVSACFAEDTSSTYKFWRNTHMKSKMGIKSYSLTPEGLSHIRLNKHNEEYSVKYPVTTVYNIMVG